MPTVIDALVVTLGFDTKNFSDNQKKAREDLKAFLNEALGGSKKIEEANKKAADSYVGVKKELLGLFATVVGVGGIEHYVAQTTQSFVQMGQAAKAAGVNVKDLFAFGTTIQRNGGDPAAARQSFTNLAGNLERFRTLGQISPELLGALQQIGANASDDPLTIFRKFARYSQGKDPRLAAQVGGQLGFDQATTNEGLKGLAQVNRDLAESYKLGTPSQKDIDKITKMNSAFIDLRQTILGDANAMLVSLAPALTTTIGFIDRLAKISPAATKAVLGLGVALVGLSGLKSVAGLLKLLGGGAAKTAPAAAEAAGAEANAAAAAYQGAGIGTAGAEAAGAAGAGGIGAALGAAGAALAGGVGLALIPSTANAGEDATMRGVNARYYKQRGSTAGTPAPGDRAKMIMAFLVANGLSAEQARGVVAGMTAENGALDPNAKNPGSTAFGLGQWTRSSGRQADFKAFSGHDIHGSSFAEQLQFILYEWTHKQSGAGSRIRGAGSADQAALAYILRYMAPDAAGARGDIGRARRALAGGVTINGGVHVHTDKHTASGIAGSMHAAISNKLSTAQANSGLTP